MRDIPVTWAAVKTAQAEAIAARDKELAARDAQIAALMALLREARGWISPDPSSNEVRHRIDAALEMSGGVL